MMLLRFDDRRAAPSVALEACERVMGPVAEAVWGDEGVGCPAVADVMLADPEEIRRINREFRGIDRPTDVLSFPMLARPPRKLSLRRLRQDIEPDTGRLMLGDLVICVDKAVEQGEEYGHGTARELGYLTAHGLLHLLGYDHGEDEPSRSAMRRREEQALAAVGLRRDGG